MVMRADLGAAKAREKALGLVCASVAVIAFLVIDALRQKARMQNIPMPGFVGIDGRAGVNQLVMVEID
jgi:uncharacterized protein YsxB (DUF464 family)